MDPAEIRFIPKVVIKEKGAEVFRQNLPIPHPVIEPFKETAPSRTVIVNYDSKCRLRRKAHTALTAPLVLRCTRIGKMREEKIWFLIKYVMGLKHSTCYADLNL